MTSEEAEAHGVVIDQTSEAELITRTQAEMSYYLQSAGQIVFYHICYTIWIKATS